METECNFCTLIGLIILRDIAHVHYLNIKVFFFLQGLMHARQASIPLVTRVASSYSWISCLSSQECQWWQRQWAFISSLSARQQSYWWSPCLSLGLLLALWIQVREVLLLGGNSTRKVQQMISTVPGVLLKWHSTDLVMGTLRGNTLVAAALGAGQALVINRYLYDWTKRYPGNGHLLLQCGWTGLESGG